jgi:hypothetical protein
MFIYPELNALLSKHGKIKTFTFFVYGKPTEEEIDLVNRGLYFRIILATRIDKETSVMLAEEIDEDAAKQLDCYQGTRLVFAFAQDNIDNALVSETIMEGLDFIRYKADFIGVKETVEDV